MKSNRTLAFAVIFFIFLLPLLVYFFLKIFGKNSFDVPVISTQPVSLCVPDSLVQPLHTAEKKSVSIYLLENNVASIQAWKTWEQQGKRVTVFQIPSTEKIKTCLHLTNENALLIDNVGRTRGLYQLPLAKENKRFETESAILLNYEK